MAWNLWIIFKVGQKLLSLLSTKDAICSNFCTYSTISWYNHCVLRSHRGCRRMPPCAFACTLTQKVSRAVEEKKANKMLKGTLTNRRNFWPTCHPPPSLRGFQHATKRDRKHLEHATNSCHAACARRILKSFAECDSWNVMRLYRDLFFATQNSVAGPLKRDF